MKKVKKLFIIIIILLIGSISVVTYKLFFEPIKVIPGVQCVRTFYKGFGYTVSSLKNKETDIQVGDVIISVNGKTIYDYTDVNEVIESAQNTDAEKIVISYIRNEKLYETYIEKGTSLGASTFMFNWITNTYISMVEPKTYRYAVDAENPFKYTLNGLFSGFSMESYISLDSFEDTAVRSLGNVVGSITNSGEKCVYGYMEPFSYDENKLVEIARRFEVKNSDAIIEFKDDENTIWLVDVTIEKHDKGINLFLKEDSKFESFYEIDISGLPLYQDGKLVGVYMWCSDSKTAYAWYAIDVYNEMMETHK